MSSRLVVVAQGRRKGAFVYVAALEVEGAEMKHCLLFALLLLGSLAHAATILVPDSSPTIQGGIVAAATGDTVLVRPGTYFENINYLQKGVILRSLVGPASTIIDGTSGGTSVVYMRDVPGNARLEGFTLRGGSGSPTPFQRQGGGVCVRDSLQTDGGPGPLIRNNWITGNHATKGGGVYIDGVCRITNNRIYVNESEDIGAGIARGDGWGLNTNPRIVSDNQIFSNRSTRPDRAGGGAALTGTSAGHPLHFLRNVVACNEAGRGGGVYAPTAEGGTVIEGNTVVLNSATPSEAGGMLLVLDNNQGSLTLRGNVVAYNVNGGIKCVPDIGAPLPVMECNDVYGNLPDFVDGGCGPVIGVNNNFSEDPRFGQIAGCPPAIGDYCLEDDSPLLPENSPPGCGQIGAVGGCLPIGVPALDSAPSIMAIHAAKPNPFSETAMIPFEIPAAGEVLVTIYNARGEAVVVQPSQQRPAGPGNVVWDGRDRSGERCPPGVYFARIEFGGRAFAARVVLVY